MVIKILKVVAVEDITDDVSVSVVCIPRYGVALLFDIIGVDVDLGGVNVQLRFDSLISKI